MTEILIAVLSSNALLALIQHLIQRRDGRKEDLKELKANMHKLERDSVRQQMLILMSDYPEDLREIMTLAERYFVQLKGDWYMTTIFNKWLEKNSIAKPEWFDCKTKGE